MQSQNILISGARAPIALEMARSFHRLGHKVIMSDSLSLTLARWSNTVTKYYRIPSPRFENQAFVSALQNIIKEEKIDHYIPTCEEAIFVAEHSAALDCKVWVSSLDLVLDLHNKHIFATKNQNLPTPQTVLLRDFLDWENSREYVFKPIYSRFATSVIIGKQIEANHFKETDLDKWIVQKRIIGKEICVYSIWENGQLKAYTAYHPLYRVGKGSGIFFEPYQDEKVLEYVRNFGETIQYTGQLCFDVILADQPYFIECNPRGTSGAHLINKHLANAFLTKETYIDKGTIHFSVKYAMLLFQFPHFFSQRVRKSKDVLFTWRDPKPFAFQILSLLEIIQIKITKKVALLEAATADIEWNQ